MTSEVVLAGCTPTPLAGYLKALGILRLVSEQADSLAKGCWRGDLFVLASELDADALQRFFLKKYRPTPIIAPWNGGSGFYFREEKLDAIDPQTGKKKKTGVRNQPTEATRTLEKVLYSQWDRFAEYREAIKTAKRILTSLRLEEAPKAQPKDELVRGLRSELSENALAAFDSTLFLTQDGTKYPPLWGTGGTDGNLDFTNNFMQRLVNLFDTDSGKADQKTADYLSQALFATSVPGLLSTAIGQFSPGNAGGANQSSGFSSNSLINPWDFVLMLEGALLFAAAATRRLESKTSGALSYPFTVRATGAGSGSSALGDEANARAEMWLPLWSARTTLPELKSLLAEGRVTIGRQPAQDGLGFARAVSKLGVDRGIGAFQRYAFMMRAGKAYFATPLNRVEVQRNPASDLIDELDQHYWLSRFRALGRGKNATSRIQSLVRRLEDNLFKLSLERDDAAPRVQNMLKLLGEAQLYLARSPAARESCPPLPWLSGEWFSKADDQSAEFVIAAALASLHARGKSGDTASLYGLPMRVHLAPEREGRRPEWLDSAGRQVSWGQGRLEDNLTATLQRRLVLSQQQDWPDKPFRSARNVPLDAIADWLSLGLDTSRIAGLLAGLMLVRVPAGFTPSKQHNAALPATYRILKPFFCTDEQLRAAGLIEAGAHLPIPPEMVRRLAASDTTGALALAQQRLRIAGIAIQFPKLDASRMDGRTLLAALLCPISNSDLQSLLPRQISHTPEIELID